MCFGAAGGGERLFDEISQRYTIIGFVDNDERKAGGNIRGIAIHEQNNIFKENGSDSKSKDSI